MAPDLKARWIEALRSGRYEQGSGRLRSYRNTFCCLGVLCDVLDPTRWDAKRTVYAEWNTASLDQRLLDEVDINYVTQDRLIALNDSDHKNFDEIASWIEEYV